METPITIEKKETKVNKLATIILTTGLMFGVSSITLADESIDAKALTVLGKAKLKELQMESSRLRYRNKHNINGGDALETSRIQSANEICAAFKGSELTTGCSLDIEQQTINIVMDLNTPTSQEVCSQAVSNMSKFYPEQQQWILKIFSPFSGDIPLASCLIM